MPRPRNAVPAYRLHRASGRACADIRDVVGRRRTVYLPGLHGSAESREAYARLVADCAAGRIPDVSPAHACVCRSIAEVLDAWQVHADLLYVGRIEAKKYGPVVSAMLDLHARRPANEFGPRDAKRVRDEIARRGYTRQTVNQCVGRMKRIMRWAASEELVEPSTALALSVVEGLRRGETDAPEQRAIRPVDRNVAQVTAAAASPVVGAMIRLRLATGMRSGELVLMRPGDTDRSGATWLYRPPSHKGAWRGRERIIPLVGRAQDVLAPFLLRPDDACCFAPAEAMRWHRERRRENRKTPMSCGNVAGSNRVEKPRKSPGDRYTNASYGTAVLAACRVAFPAPSDATPEQAKEWHRRHAWTPHQIRHLVATEVRAKLGVEAARTALGHASLGATMIYAEADIRVAADALRAIAS